MSADAPGGPELSLGIDIGGTAIKAGIVDMSRGEIVAGRTRVATPEPSAPEQLLPALVEVVDDLRAAAAAEGLISRPEELASLPIGVAFPGRVKNGVVTFLGTVDQGWVGRSVQEDLRRIIGTSCQVANDGDVALLAEMRFGAGRGREQDLVAMTTLGTGVGSALCAQGVLVAGTELGQFLMHGRSAERWMAESAKRRDGLSFEEWAERLQEYYRILELVIAPDLLIIGGGISQAHEEFLHLVEFQAEVRPAQLFNDAGVVGAAILGAGGRLAL